MIRVTRRPRAEAGGCNFCDDRTHRTVYEVRSDGPATLAVRFCLACLDGLRTQTRRLARG